MVDVFRAGWDTAAVDESVAGDFCFCWDYTLGMIDTLQPCFGVMLIW